MYVCLCVCVCRLTLQRDADADLLWGSGTQRIGTEVRTRPSGCLVAPGWETCYQTSPLSHCRSGQEQVPLAGCLSTAIPRQLLPTCQPQPLPEQSDTSSCRNQCVNAPSHCSSHVNPFGNWNKMSLSARRWLVEAIRMRLYPPAKESNFSERECECAALFSVRQAVQQCTSSAKWNKWNVGTNYCMCYVTRRVGNFKILVL